MKGTDWELDASAPALRTRTAELASCIRALTSHRAIPDRKFVIFAHYRTGSTLLMSLMNSHAQIHCERELLLDFVRLKRQKVLFPHLFIKGSMPRSGSVACGFVLRLDQLERVLPRFHKGPESFLSRLVSDGWKIIHLKREDHLRQALSNVTALARGQFHNGVGVAREKSTVHIDPQALIRTIGWMRNVSRKEHELMEKLAHVTVVYEHDLLDSGRHQAVAERIFDYLGLESQPVTARYRRMSSDNLLEGIVNSAEIREVIRNAGYAADL